MKLPNIECARALRDGGIDAVAALNQGLKDALESVPVEDAREVKLAVGRAMTAVLEETINRAVRQYPELKVEQPTWIEIARTRAAARTGA